MPTTIGDPHLAVRALLKKVFSSWKFWFVDDFYQEPMRMRDTNSRGTFEDEVEGKFDLPPITPITYKYWHASLTRRYTTTNHSSSAQDGVIPCQTLEPFFYLRSAGFVFDFYSGVRCRPDSAMGL